MNDFLNPDDFGKNNQSKEAATFRPAKEALWTSEMQLQTLFDAAPIGIYLVDADFCIRAVNPAALPVFGGITDLIGRDFDEVIHILWSKEYADEIVRLFRHTLRTGEPYFTPERTELRRDRNVTEYYEWQINRIPLTAASYGVVCYFRDIIERKQTEKALRHSEEKYRTLFDSIDEGFCLIEILFDEQGKAADYRFLEMNPIFERQSGLENARGKTILELVPDLEPQWAETYGQVARTGEAVRFEADVAAMNRIFDIYAFPANTPDTVAVLFSDITERKQIETDLRESEERLRLAVAAGELGTWDWNLATGEVYWNERHFILFGMPPRPNPLRAEEFFRHIHPEDAERVRGQLEKAVSDKTIFQTEFRAVTDAGETRWMDGYGQTVETDASGKTVRMSGVMFDVTELKRAEDIQREKETLQRMIGAQEDERRRIAQDLHDHLGQQLTALRLKIESIKIMCDGDEALSERVDEAQAVAARIDADIDFLAWQMRPSALDDIGLAAALANYVGEWSNQFQIPADFTAGRFGKNRLAADAETHLYRIAQEALNNVYKHARARGVDVALERRDGFAVLIVEDDGIGFAPDKVSGKKNQKRIGLSGMKERAALVGGKVQIESAPGKGTTVFARVPVADSEKPIKKKKKKDE